MSKENKVNENHHEIVVVGGGSVGMLMALALARLNRQIILIEKLATSQINKGDDRSIALSYSSVCILNSLGVWCKIKEYVEFIKQVHTSDKGHYGQVNLYAKDEGVAFLGVVIKIKHLFPVLYQLLMEQSNITLYQNCQVLDLFEDKKSFRLVIKDNAPVKITADLIIAADGSQSKLRAKASIIASEHDYKQSALVFDLYLQKNHESIAYERFINNGVLALLPAAQKKMACVWTVDCDMVEHWDQKDKSSILKEIQRLMGYRLGRFLGISTLKSFPLSLIQAQVLYRKNLLLFGNASHFLHPVLGQGLNLSIRDIGVLYDLLAAKGSFSPQSVQTVLDKYQETRACDHKRTALLTHSIIDIFAHSSLPVRFVRGAGIYHLERDQHLKKVFSKLLMGNYNHGSTLIRTKSGKDKL